MIFMRFPPGGYARATLRPSLLEPPDPFPPGGYAWATFRPSLLEPPDPSSARVRQQGHLAGVLDGGRHVPLVLDAVAGHAPSTDLAAVRDELTQHDHVLV